MVTRFEKEMWRSTAGVEFSTKEDAIRHDVETQIHQILNDRSAYGEIEVSTAVEVIMKNWSTIVTIMDQLD